jgi:hypothetical protein
MTTAAVAALMAQAEATRKDAFCDAFPHKFPAKARYVRNYLELHDFGLMFMNKSGKNNARISKIKTKKRKYSAVNLHLNLNVITECHHLIRHLNLHLNLNVITDCHHLICI